MSEATSSQAVEIWIPAMIRRSIATVLKFGAVVCLLFALLFADGPGVTIYGFIGSVIREITAVLRDLDTQWMVFLCLGIYFTAFVVLRRKARLASRLSQRGDPTAWLTVSLFVAAVVYAFNYSPSTQAVTLMAGAVIGQGFGFWGGFITQNSVADEVTRLKSKSSQSLLTSSATILVVLLALVSVWQAEAPHTFAYHGQARWSGPWENPNLAGLLMGAGAVLATGLGLRGWRMEMLSPQSTVRNLSCSLRSLRLKENWLVVGACCSTWLRLSLWCALCSIVTAGGRGWGRRAGRLT